MPGQIKNDERQIVMATFASKIASLQNLNRYFESGDFQRDIQVVCALGMAAEIRDRVQNTGINSSGSGFRPYSRRNILVGAKSFNTVEGWNTAYEMANKESKTKAPAGSQGSKNLENTTHWVTIAYSKGAKSGKHLISLFGGYKKVRELDGLKSNFRSFSRTNEMWVGFGIKKGNKKNTVAIGGTKPASQDKINWNSGQLDINIIAASQYEIDNYTRLMTQMINKKYYDTISN